MSDEREQEREPAAGEAEATAAGSSPIQGSDPAEAAPPKRAARAKADAEEPVAAAPRKRAGRAKAGEEKPAAAASRRRAGRAKAGAEKPADEQAKPARRRAASKKPAEAKAAAEPEAVVAAGRAAAASPKPARTRGAGRRDASGVVVRAQARYVRTSARKARLVSDHLRGKSVVEARAILALTTRSAARDWSKVLESAIANAEHNHELVGDELRVAAAYADEGPTLKRFRPRAMGRATRIRKRTSHLTITLTPGS